MGAGIDLDKAEALINAGQIPDAVPILEKFVARKPRESRALHLVGVAKSMLGQHQQAAEFLQRARALKPQDVKITTDLAIVLIMLRRDTEALALLEKVHKREPDLRIASFYTGMALANLERHNDAVEVFRELVRLDPDNGLYLQNWAAVLAKVNRFEEAEAIVDRLLKKQTTTEALLVKSVAAVGRELFGEAIEICDRLLARDPMHAEAAYNRGHLRLLTGDLAAGWPDYEARLRRENFRIKPPCDDAPHWSGEPLGGKSLLVYTEQGLGDIILTSRYLPMLIDLGCEVTFLAPRSMIRLLRSGSSRVQYVDKVPEQLTFDFQVPIMSLPLRFATTLATVPGRTPYLFAEPEKVAHWREVVGGQGFKVAIAWQGNIMTRAGLERSIPLREFQPLSQVPGVRLISLQKNQGVDQLSDLPAGMHVETLGDDFDSGPDAFVDTAAVMQNVDVIVAPDTSIANLAGALRRPAMVALGSTPDWRWLLGQPDSPWYPDMKLFRRTKDGSWREVFEQIEEELKRQRP